MIVLLAAHHHVPPTGCRVCGVTILRSGGLSKHVMRHGGSASARRASGNTASTAHRLQVAEHGLDDAQSPAVERPALAGIDPRLHGLGVWMRFPDLAAEEGDLAVDTDVGLSQALRTQRTAAAGLLGTFEADALVSLDDGVGGTDLEHLTVRAATGLLLGVVLEVIGGKPLRTPFAGPPLLVRRFVLVGFGKPRIARPKARVGDQRSDTLIVQLLQRVFAVLSRIRQVQCVPDCFAPTDRFEVFARSRGDLRQQCVLLPRAERFGVQTTCALPSSAAVPV